MLFQNILASPYTKHKKEDKDNICPKWDNSYLKKKIDVTELCDIDRFENQKSDLNIVIFH